ncbi:unnamed protein product [Nippostrongylus brasiliensis]|uniref:Beta-lactamase-related domain-containing protein n=1 Tax=Nippostrongylus brasiliensis TaxID=27835 RepID=A0A3P7BSV0_NIPBR|nr:unnamed protein product [Nippostrongylus brasiliensis]
MELPLGAVTGVSSAGDLSRLFSLVIDGTLLSNETLEKLSTPTLDSWHLEKVTLWPVRKGRGFFYEPNPLIPYILVDPHNQLVLSYVANGLKTGSSELCHTYMRLFRAAYNSIRGR